MPALIHADAVPQSIVMDKARESFNTSDEIAHVNITDNGSDKCVIPFIAVPEKIVLCIDISEDCKSVPYVKSDNTKCKPFDVLKKALKIFALNKLSLNQEHQLAIVTVEPGALNWILDFSCNEQEILETIGKLNPIEHINSHSYNFTPVFKEMKTKIGNLPVAENNCGIPPHIVRVFLIYNSSTKVPVLDKDDENYKSLISSDNFMLDLLYLHDPLCSENDCQEVYNSLLLFAKEGSYFYEVSRKVTKVFNVFAKYLAHPFQRPCNEFHRQLQTSEVDESI